ncbi:glycerate kinase [Thiogranum longum]|uniref:Glycerate kinase n=1 Tax=Thiogranum longum TaxID=1537524 RepID=A0A4R1H9R1_9GAMM|nr:glycerate kinase [Thiogranum longum]TCK18644.1 glycerate kinase [Thiogranum longum]
MKIVIAPNALKGSLSAAQAAEALAAGCRQAAPQAELVVLPVADGGDGLVAVLTQALKAAPKTLRVSGPLGQPVEADWLYCDEHHRAVIETAAAAGLALLDPQELAPMTANTRGVGELILAALDAGAQRILLGIGGSATSDGGMGMAQALGVVFRDREGRIVEAGGSHLTEIAGIDSSNLDPRLREVQIQVICDVDNPLLGARGAARVFAPQKGADAAQVEQLEAGLAQYAGQLEHFLGKDVRNIAGAGAAGGLGAGAIAFLNAELKPGAELVLELLKFDDALEGADLVITAEGQLDGQTAFGKAPAAVARHARAAGIPCIAIAGSLGEGANELDKIGITKVYTLCRDSVSVEDAMSNAAEYLRETAALATRSFCL